MTRTVVFAAALALCASFVSANCPVATTSGYSGYSCVNLAGTGFPNTDVTVAGAAAFWNQSGCGDDGGAGLDYPRLSASNGCASGSPSMPIRWVGGYDSTDGKQCLVNGVQAYCAGVYNTTTHAITIYSLYGPNGTTPTPTSGVALQNLIAHEIGHALGLGDDTCTNGIENPTVPTSPVVTSEECEQVDKANKVPNEPTNTYGGGGGGGGSCDPNSDPTCCEFFPGYPGCDGGGGGGGGGGCYPDPCDYGPIKQGTVQSPPPK
jgi:hypothetical protein